MEQEAPPPESSRAAPNRNATTGRSPIAELGATLAANFTITNNENEPEYPLTIHLIDASVLFRIFYFITFSICSALNRELGYPDLAVPAQLQFVINIAQSVAFDALDGAYAVLYNKARRHDFNVVRGQPIPAITFSTFPAFITILINALGPVQRSDLPSRRTHVPFMNRTSVDAQRPAAYRSFLSARFHEKLAKSKFLTAAVEYHGVASNAWWTFWPVPVSNTNVSDISVVPPVNLRTYRVFSPIKYDEIEPYFKIATIYGQAPLIRPGISFFSTSEWYDEDTLGRFQGLPNPDQFPVATRNFPAFVSTCSAYVVEVRNRVATIEQVLDQQSIAGPADSVSRLLRRSPRLTGRQRAPPPTKRRFVAREESPTFRPRSPNAQMAEQEQIQQYSLIYYYFDHIALDEAKPHEYSSWAVKANGQA